MEWITNQLMSIPRENPGYVKRVAVVDRELSGPKRHGGGEHDGEKEIEEEDEKGAAGSHWADYGTSSGGD